MQSHNAQRKIKKKTTNIIIIVTPTPYANHIFNVIPIISLAHPHFPAWQAMTEGISEIIPILGTKDNVSNAEQEEEET